MTPRSLPFSTTGSWLMPSCLSVAITSFTFALPVVVTILCLPRMRSTSLTVPRPGSSSRKPFSRIQSSLKIFETYF